VVTEGTAGARRPGPPRTGSPDRQVAPALLSYGTEEQRRRLLPRIAAGRLYSAIGMSEHGAGSDLAAAQTRASRAAGGWILNGSKVWTSGAHVAHQIRRAGPNQPIGPSASACGFFPSSSCKPRAPGITIISRFVLMNGEHHFNEVIFDGVFIPR
jgi:acyl-CoA dehydrogenase